MIFVKMETAFRPGHLQNRSVELVHCCIKSKTNTLTHAFGVVEISSHYLTGAAISIANATAILFSQRANNAVTADFLPTKEQ